MRWWWQEQSGSHEIASKKTIPHATSESLSWLISTTLLTPYKNEIFIWTSHSLAVVVVVHISPRLDFCTRATDCLSWHSTAAAVCCFFGQQITSTATHQPKLEQLSRGVTQKMLSEFTFFILSTFCYFVFFLARCSSIADVVVVCRQSDRKGHKRKTTNGQAIYEK